MNEQVNKGGAADDTVEGMWRTYARNVLPPDAPTVQHTECRRAFYAGAWALFWAVKEKADNLPEGEAEAWLTARQGEMADFYKGDMV